MIDDKFISFMVYGTPKPQPRPRAFARKMGNGKFAARVYDAGTAEAWKSAVAWRAREFQPPEPITGPIDVSLQFWLPRPKGHHVASDPSRPLKTNAPRHHTGKPDCDNLAKAVLDCLTQIGFWVDDSQVIHLRVRKAYVGTYGNSGVAVLIERVES